MDAETAPPKVSVVIPVLDRRDLIEETLRTIRGQTFPDFECLVVDDGSRDGTRDLVLELAREDSRIRLLVKRPGAPRGPSPSRNVGLAAARGEYVHFFDSDDLLDPGFYERTVSRMQEGNLDFYAVGIRWFLSGAPSRPIARETELSKPFVREDFVANAVVSRHQIWTQNVLWRRDLLVRTGWYREDLAMIEDLEYAVRAMLAARRFGFEDTPLVLIRRHEKSLTFDLDPERRRRRLEGEFDSYLAILDHIDKAGVSRPWLVDHCHTLLYNALSGGIRTGVIGPGLLRRFTKFLGMALADRKWRTLFRFGLLGFVYWGLGSFRWILRKAVGRR